MSNFYLQINYNNQTESFYLCRGSLKAEKKVQNKAKKAMKDFLKTNQINIDNNNINSVSIFFQNQDECGEAFEFPFNTF